MTDYQSKLGYNPKDLPRELNQFYIAANDQDISSMLETLKLDSLDQLFNHIDKSVRFEGKLGLDDSPSYDQLIELVEKTANKNNIPLNFLGDGLPQYKQDPIVPFVCNLRGLTTAYTPYQPERSQGTLHTLWIYASSISALTGFEAINASLYERSTCLFEALKTAQRLHKNKNKVVVCDSIYPSDKAVLQTIVKHTDLEVIYAPICKESGLTDIDALEEILKTQEGICALAFNQINGLGLIEDVNELTDIANNHGLSSIAVIDPILMAKNGLQRPSEFGSNKSGTTMFVAEGQHLCLDANYGGPGLGIFGIRFNDANKTDIRATAGRYIGKAIDADGKECLAIVLSTREQHIRREKATSNICSNQSFIASAAGASLLAHGDEGLSEKIQKSRNFALKFLENIQGLEGIKLAFDAPFYNEIVLEIKDGISLLTDNNINIVAGKNISNRYGISRNLLKISFSDLHTEDELAKLIELFRNSFKAVETEFDIPELPEVFTQTTTSGLKKFSFEELKIFYTKLGELNVSPDDAIYPLGSCTMKYNPYINDWAAGLPKFTMAHPDLPQKYVQGTLEVLYEIQEDFKKITGLPGVTGQPVAGAQGELVGLKLFQAYHEDKGNAATKNLIIIPRSAHGTNPATATMAGYETKKVDGKLVGIVSIDADERGQINLEQLEKVIKEDGDRVAGIMITNPNTSGVFEEKFKYISDLIHSVDGLVYMDGANMNAIAGHIDLGKLGVDAVHNNLHKTWTIPHGGGGPGDAIVAVSEKLIPFLPGILLEKSKDGIFSTYKAPKSIGEFHRHGGNFAHKVRAYTYIKALGEEGVKKMSAVSVLSARYLYQRLRQSFPTLPFGADETPRMHEFIITPSNEMFESLAKGGTPKASAVAKLGKLFLDFGLHAPTVAFPEVFGLMIEPTESFSKAELDDFAEVVETIKEIIFEMPQVTATTPHFTPIKKVDEVWANKNLCFASQINELPQLPADIISPKKLRGLTNKEIMAKIYEANLGK